jgi:hypothetical protein
MVKGVDPKEICSNDLLKTALRCYDHIVEVRGILGGAVTIEMLNHAATSRHIENLAPPADAKYRHIDLQGSARKRQFKLITRSVNAASFSALVVGAKVFGIDVTPTGENQTVKMIKNFGGKPSLGIRLVTIAVWQFCWCVGGQDDRSGAEIRQRIEVVLCVPANPLHVTAPGGDANY